MRMKSLILIFIALGCGLVASIGISQVMDRGGDSSNVEMEQILVALADIDIGSKFDAQNVKLEDWPKNKVPEGAIRKLDEVNEKFANARFYRGEPLHVSKITEQAGSVSSFIPDGYRAMPVKVEEDTVMKAISPGDKVDVMVFLKRDEQQGIQETSVYTILKNVRVFAINTNTERSSGESNSKSESSNFRTVSLLLKPEHTRELAVATRVGKILLTLRRPDEQDLDTGDEELTPLSEILNAKASNASDPVAQGSTTPFSRGGIMDVVRGAISPAGPVAAAPAPEVAWTMQVFGPSGAEQYDWTDKKDLPTKGGSLQGAAPPAAEQSAPQVEPTTEDEPTSPTQPEETKAGLEGATGSVR